MTADDFIETSERSATAEEGARARANFRLVSLAFQKETDSSLFLTLSQCHIELGGLEKHCRGRIERKRGREALRLGPGTKYNCPFPIVSRLDSVSLLFEED
ncbi:uncharacterized protein CELE_ZK112.4 [Caenorhabditis elegans]|uniref:Uncharacterized protein ZK112.4 n=1 Tax=Caenorhabditis elegans TaxID=6239 RepID=YOG4_CAEEL|nr:Uncharacterized protein CELE_ZK112.4 [Caenorhabditis elegans]P34613.1 RecName: Full=Uncharacterized protein ZK112.4 [Caenorhabditis elegans]CCD62765.1 Uncharacterized protein CELE_ZK112.4 [Caenorhabditis elegans]|eukprot:NP_498683.1 Uncharacterized protein CELE_ZK112.4 [Caenorhabditis elegans]